MRKRVYVWFYKRDNCKDFYGNIGRETDVQGYSQGYCRERCGVNRNTFYYHFRDIPDVVEFVLKRKWDEIQEAPQEKNSILECMEEMASLVRDNRKLMLNVYKSVKRDTFLIYMNDVILYIITEYFKKNRNKFQLEENEIQILVRYY